MNDAQNTPDTVKTASPADAAADERGARLESLVAEWLSVPELAEAQSLKVNDVRRQLKDGEFVGVRRGPNNAVYVPARFVADGKPLRRLKGTLTVLKDGGMDDAEVIEWLFSPDTTLPTGGSPLEAIEAGHFTEVRRRAMESAL